MNLDDLMNYEYVHNSWINDILTSIKTNQCQHKNIMLIKCEIQNNWLYYYDTLIILNFELL